MKRIVSLLLVFLILSLFLGCGKKKKVEGVAPPPPPARKALPKVALVVKTLNNPFFVTMEEEAKKRAKELNVELIVQAPEREIDVEKQITIVENLIQMGVKVICIAPCGSKEIVSAILKANEANIPVIIVDTRVNEEALEAAGATIAGFVGSDNYKGGQLAAEYIGEKLGGKGKIALLEGIPGHETGDARKNGFLETIKEKYPDIEVVASQTANWERGLGFDVFQNMLTAHPEIQALFACNDMMALGAIEAISVAGKTKDIIVVGFDAIEDSREAIKEGKMSGSVAQFPGEMGRISIENAVKLINGEKIPPVTPTRVELITKENL